jgi:hypothetical protein
MADFARWVVAAEPALPWEPGGFMEAYTANREAADDLAIETSPVGHAIVGLMQDRSEWSGTAQELLAKLSADRHSDENQGDRI